MNEHEDWARYNGEGKWDFPENGPCEAFTTRYGEEQCGREGHYKEDGHWWCWQHRPSRWHKEKPCTR